VASYPIPYCQHYNPPNPLYKRGFKETPQQRLRGIKNIIKHVNLRYFNAAGADPDGEIGEWHEPETHLIPLVLDVASGRREDIKIFGPDYETPDGTCIRDYIHVIDLGNAHILALEYLLNAGVSDSFNLGNGNGFSVKEVIETAKSVTGRSIKAVESERRPGDPPVLVGSAEKAKVVLGWKLIYNDLAIIIETAWKWHKEVKTWRKYLLLSHATMSKRFFLNFSGE